MCSACGVCSSHGFVVCMVLSFVWCVICVSFVVCVACMVFVMCIVCVVCVVCLSFVDVMYLVSVERFVLLFLCCCCCCFWGRVHIVLCV